MSHPHPELGSPPQLPANGVRIVALGGLGEIGRNMTVFEYEGKLLGGFLLIWRPGHSRSLRNSEASIISETSV